VGGALRDARTASRVAQPLIHTHGRDAAAALTPQYNAHGNTKTLAPRPCPTTAPARRIRTGAAGVIIAYTRHATDRIIARTQTKAGASTTTKYGYSGDGYTADLTDPVRGGADHDYAHPSEPINDLDPDGRLHWRKVGKWVATGAGFVGAVATWDSIPWGLAVGAAAGAAAYSASHAGTQRFSWIRIARSAVLGAAGGEIFGFIRRIALRAARRATSRREPSRV
jgi:hypothetical protein